MLFKLKKLPNTCHEGMTAVEVRVHSFFNMVLDGG